MAPAPFVGGYLSFLESLLYFVTNQLGLLAGGGVLFCSLVCAPPAPPGVDAVTAARRPLPRNCLGVFRAFVFPSKF